MQAARALTISCLIRTTKPLYFSLRSEQIKKPEPYVGEFSSGLVISWDKAAVDQTDQFTYQEGTASATLKAHDGTISTFTISDVQEDTAILNSLNTGE